MFLYTPIFYLKILTKIIKILGIANLIEGKNGKILSKVHKEQ
jgi:hypothetical protein